MWQLRNSREDDGPRVVEIWRRSVDASHDFLSRQDRVEIEQMVRDFLPKSPLVLAIDEAGCAVGFMLLSGSHMDALFIDPEFWGKGVGQTLVSHAVAQHPVLTTDVNEQNVQAVRFYNGMGFVETGRSPLDGQGRPYPLIHLRFGAQD